MEANLCRSHMNVMSLPLRLIPESAVLPIPMGMLRGSRWVVGSGRYVAWLGTYERAHQAVFARVVGPGMTVWDIGAHVGFHTLLLSKLVGPSGHVLSVEALPRNLAFLGRHVELNRCRNVEIVGAAILDRTGEVTLGQGTYRGYTARAGSGTDAIVQCQTLDSLPGVPDVIKMDIEGEEATVLAASSRVLARRPRIVLAVHGANIESECRALLARYDYSVSDIGPGDLLAEPA